MQFGFNEQNKKFVISAAGQGQVELTYDQVNEFMDFVIATEAIKNNEQVKKDVENEQ